MSKRKPPNEIQQLRAQIDSVKSETRKLQEKFFIGNQQLQNFSIQQEKLMTYFNQVNEQKKVFDEQITAARECDMRECQKIEQSIQRIDQASHEKILFLLQLRNKFIHLAHDTQNQILQLQEKIEQNIQIYDSTIKQRTTQINEATKKLKELERKEVQLLVQFTSGQNSSNGQATQRDDSLANFNIIGSHIQASPEQEKIQKQIDVLTKFKDHLSTEIAELKKRCGDSNIDFTPGSA